MLLNNLREVLESIPHWGFIFNDSSGEIIYVNKRFSELFIFFNGMRVDGFMDRFCLFKEFRGIPKLSVEDPPLLFQTNDGKKLFRLIAFNSISDDGSKMVFAVEESGFLIPQSNPLNEDRIYSECAKGLAVFDRDGKTLYFNKAFSKVSEKSIEEHMDLIPFLEKFSELNSEEIPRMLETSNGPISFKSKHKSGDVLAWKIFINSEERNRERFVLCVGKANELNDRIEQIDVSSNEIGNIIDSMTEFVHLIDRKFKIILANLQMKKFCMDMGIDSDIEGKDFLEIFSFIGGESLKEYIDVFEKGKPLVTIESTYINGDRYWTRTQKIPVFSNGEVDRILTLVSDITEFKKREELSKIHSNLLSKVNDLSASLLLWDSANEDLLSVIASGFTKLINQGYSLISLYDENSGELEVKVIDNIGKVLPIIIPILGKTPVGMRFLTPDDFKNRLLSGKLFTLPGGIYDSTFGTIPLYLCTLIEKLLHVKKVVTTGLVVEKRFIGAVTLFLTDESWLDEDVISQYINMAAFAIVRHLEQQQRERFRKLMPQNQKLETLGLLTAGIAHDFNNLLTSINGNAELIKFDVKDQATIELVDDVLSSAGKASQLTHRLLSFAREQQDRKLLFCVSERILGLKNILRRSIEERVDLVFSEWSQNCYIEMDPVQFDQVILNLVVNARDAMEGEGKISIYGTLVNLEGADDPGEGMWCKVCVADNGAGIDDAVLPNIFDAFFTTKEKDRGTGLGLATVKQIMDKVGGTVSVRTQKDAGSTFELYFRCQVDEVPAKTMRRQKISTNGECVLLVEDEGIVLSIAEKMLKKAGYNVSTSDSGEKALRMIADGFRPEVVVTDVIMPGISGKDLVDKILKVYTPAILFVSGYPEGILGNHGVEISARNFLVKPYSSEELVSAISNLLNSGDLSE